jgi:hypothetical protein
MFLYSFVKQIGQKNSNLRYFLEELQKNYQNFGKHQINT